MLSVLRTLTVRRAHKDTKILDPRDVSVLNWASLNESSFDTLGRLKLREAPSVSSSCASVSLFIVEPRSE